MNVALYLRMSSDKQEASIPQQEKALRELCERKAYRVVAVYKDEGISGDATEKRKAFLRMIAEAPAGKWKRILAYDQDRFGRFDMLEAGFYISPLRKAGIRLETIAQGVVDWNNFAGRVIYGIQQEGKHQFLRDISRNVLRGLTSKAEAGEGFHGGPTPYGYRRDTVRRGSRHISKLVPEPGEAAVVRRIFEEYAQPNASCGTIAEGLNRDMVPTARGEVWRRTTIRRLLGSQTYAGDFQWGLRDTGKYSIRTANGIAQAGGDEEQRHAGPIVHRDAEAIEPIVPRELFDTVQRLLAERKIATRSPAKVRPLSGLVVCQQCGRAMHSDNGGFRCPTSSDHTPGKRCSGSRVPAGRLLDGLAAGIEAKLLEPRIAKLLPGRIAKLVAASQAQPSDGQEQALAGRLEALERQLADGAARLTLVPVGLVPELAKALEGIRQERDAAKARLEALRAQQPQGVVSVEEIAHQVLASAKAVRKALQAADAGAANDGLRRLGTRIGIERNDTGGVVAHFSIGEILPGRLDSNESEFASSRRLRALVAFSLTIRLRKPSPGRPSKRT
jgi:DNA invertase Pin-like site-specific DNA recombinase